MNNTLNITVDGEALTVPEGISVAAALVLTGFLSARAGGTRVARAIVRNVVGGLLAMAVTYGIGRLVGHTLG